MSRSCSHCGNNGHNSRTCGEAGGDGSSSNSVVGADTAEKGIMLFGVRVTAEGGSFRKSVSMNNLSQYDQPQDSNAEAGYASDDVVHASGRGRERKRGVPWTEEEHKLFLLGLQKVGKGDWRGISRNFVKTRTPTQVASHAQKYFLRRINQNRRRRRSSLFDITTDTYMNLAMEEDRVHPKTSKLPLEQPQQQSTGDLGTGFPMSSTFPVTLSPQVSQPTTGENSMQNLTLGPNKQVKASSKLIRPIPILPFPPSAKMADLNMNEKNPIDPTPISLRLSTPSSGEQSSPPATHATSFQGRSSGDNIISVA
ncbi:Myb_DNA-binding domain-containing protein [Cephalotus follicularis]|uniref:Myb_DNA-binding domain-containing protein n=1 Tax=Cephalotus follicularis TaxID=3775 RepID=A0A1Q3DG23_CEPFO|nr:Myb_DNA-binding domain-containing protein [Cephalotus follicularis]